VGGGLEFESDPEKMFAKALAHIDTKRAALNLPVYDPTRFVAGGDRRVCEWMALPPEEREAAIHGKARAPSS